MLGVDARMRHVQCVADASVAFPFFCSMSCVILQSPYGVLGADTGLVYANVVFSGLVLIESDSLPFHVECSKKCIFQKYRYTLLSPRRDVLPTTFPAVLSGSQSSLKSENLIQDITL